MGDMKKTSRAGLREKYSSWRRWEVGKGFLLTQERCEPFKMMIEKESVEKVKLKIQEKRLIASMKAQGEEIQG